MRSADFKLGAQKVFIRDKKETEFWASILSLLSMYEHSTQNHIMIKLVEAKHTTLNTVEEVFLATNPSWIEWTHDQRISLIHILVKVSLVLTCICHNRCNGTTLSVSVKEVTCISWHERYKAHTKAIKLQKLHHHHKICIYHRSTLPYLLHSLCALDTWTAKMKFQF